MTNGHNVDRLLKTSDSNMVASVMPKNGDCIDFIRLELKVNRFVHSQW